MDLGLDGKVVAITGGSMGIGKAIALCMAREGCRISICARGRERLDEAAGEIRGNTGREVLAVAADLTRDADAREFIDSTAAHYGRIDVLVNNAGAAPGGVLEGLSEADWEAALQLKFMGYVRCTRHAIPHMRRQGGGRIVNLIGNDGVKHSYWEIAPGAANAAGQNFTLSIAAQYARENITLVAVNPGPVRTERWDGLVRAMSRDMNIPYEEADGLAPKSIPLGRIAEPEEVGNLVTYLASPLAHFVNGTMIEIDGGQQKPVMDAARDR